MASTHLGSPSSYPNPKFCPGPSNPTFPQRGPKRAKPTQVPNPKPQILGFWDPSLGVPAHWRGPPVPKTHPSGPRNRPKNPNFGFGTPKFSDLVRGPLSGSQKDQNSFPAPTQNPKIGFGTLQGSPTYPRGGPNLPRGGLNPPLKLKTGPRPQILGFGIWIQTPKVGDPSQNLGSDPPQGSPKDPVPPTPAPKTPPSGFSTYSQRGLPREGSTHPSQLAGGPRPQILGVSLDPDPQNFGSKFLRGPGPVRRP